MLEVHQEHGDSCRKCAGARTFSAFGRAPQNREGELTTMTEIRGAFGEVLEETIRSRGIEPTRENIRELGRRSGLDEEGFLAAAMGDRSAEAGGRGLTGLEVEMALTEREMRALGWAYAYGTRPPAQRR